MCEELFCDDFLCLTHSEPLIKSETLGDAVFNLGLVGAFVMYLRWKSPKTENTTDQ